MPRPRKIRKISFSPNAHYYKPLGVPLRTLEEVNVSYEEMESLRLKHFEKLEQTGAAEKMQISQPTYNRHLNSALEKISIAMLKGKAIRISDEK